MVWQVGADENPLIFFGKGKAAKPVLGDYPVLTRAAGCI
jgi:hypothetical protein